MLPPCEADSGRRLPQPAFKACCSLSPALAGSYPTLHSNIPSLFSPPPATPPAQAGTNAEHFKLLAPERLTAEEVGQLPTDDLSEDVRTGMFFEFLKAQEGGFQGGFDGEPSLSVDVSQGLVRCCIQGDTA